MRKGDEPCVACEGGAIPCKGGGNLLCWRRHAGDQHVALILDTYGGTRIIVGTSESIEDNTRHDELCHVVPNLIVHEPIAWGDIPIVIERARVEFEIWLDRRPNLDEDLTRSVTLYRLRRLEQDQQSIDLYSIAET